MINLKRDFTFKDKKTWKYYVVKDRNLWDIKQIKFKKNKKSLFTWMSFFNIFK